MTMPPSSSVESDESKEKMIRSSGRTLSKMERVRIVSTYVALFAIVIFVVFTFLDAYACYSHGKFDGNIRIANIDLTSTGDVDLSMELTADAWLQSRLHTMRVDVAGCMVKIDTPSGRHLDMMHATNSLPLTIKPKSLWSPWDGSTFQGHDAPVYSVNGVIALSHVNFTSVGTMLVDAVIVPPTDVPHSLVVECVIDGAVELFSVPAMSIPLKKYVYTTRKDFHIDPPTVDGTKAVKASNRRSLTLITDIATQLKSILSSIPSIGSSLAMISQTDLESFVSDVASNPANILGLLFYPFTGVQGGQLDLNDKYNVLQLDFDYDLNIPAQYVPSFLVNVYVPPLAVRMSSGTPGSGFSWLVSTQSFILDLSQTTTVDSNIQCGMKVGDCTLMTPVFGFVSNAFTNQQDTWVFDMIGDDNVVYRALGRHTNIRYSAILDYQIASENTRVMNYGITSCLNVTLADRWGVKNACFVKESGQPEVDLSFDIPSFDGTSGSYFGMSSAFTWTYAALSSKPSAKPTNTPTSPPSSTPSIYPTFMPSTATPSTVAPSQPTVSPSIAPSLAPTSPPTITPTSTPSCTPTSTPTIAHTSTLVVIQEVRGLNQHDAVETTDFAQTFADALDSLTDDPTYPIPSSVTFTLLSITYELYCPNCWGNYVTRVKYTASVLNHDDLLPLVSSNLAASVYSGTLQKFLRTTGGYNYAQIDSTGSFRAQLPESPTSQPTTQPSSHPTRQPASHPTTQPSSHPTTHPSAAYHGSVAPSYQPTKPGATMTPSAPTRSPTTGLPTRTPPTRSPLASDGCVHLGFIALQSQAWNDYRYTIPTFGNSGEQVYYNVTMILAGGWGYLGTAGNWYESGQLYQDNNGNPKEFGPYSVLGDDTGLLVEFYPYHTGSYFRATICPFQTVPTAMPTQLPAVDISAEGNAVCAIGKAFNFDAVRWPFTASLWPLSTICSTDTNPITTAMLTNSSGMPVWCTWPFLSCDTRSKAVVAFDQGKNGYTNRGTSWNNWWGSSALQAATVPTAFGSLSSLQRLSLHGVKLTGTIPASIFSSLNQLTYLDLASNSLTGTIPSTINVALVPQKGSTQLDLSYNYLTGTVPSGITKLQYAQLNNNKYQWNVGNNCFLTSPDPSIRSRFTYSQGRCSTAHSPASIAAEGQALCQIAKALSNVIVKNVWNGRTNADTYPFGPYVYYQGSTIKHGYNPSNSTCYYDVTKPLYQPEWCTGRWGSGAIGCDAHYSITSLYVSGNFWTKSTNIPTAIGSLTNLQNLQITTAGLSGPIPSSLGGLSRLTNLNLRYNMLTGSVPAFIANVWSPTLQDNCNLTSSIPSISNQMTDNHQGACSGDRTVIFAEGQAICKIAQALFSVRINVYSYTMSTYVPKPVFSNNNWGDTSLRYGYNPANSTCSYNTSLPLYTPKWCNNWKGIGCSQNKVTSLHIDADSWTKSAKIPTAIGSLTNLQDLYISNAGLSGSIPNFMGLSKLTRLQMSNNRLTGDVPAFINAITTRPNTRVDFYQNCNLTRTSTSPMATGSSVNYDNQGQCAPGKPADIAAEGFAICSLSFGRQPIWGWNTATGCYYNTSKPVYRPSWCDWSYVDCDSGYSIKSLWKWSVYWDSSSNYLTQNNLKRTIPSSLAALKGLTSLRLSSMGFTGPIPTVIYSLNKLAYLDLGGNSFTGSIPTVLASFKQLSDLRLSNNRLNGTLPAVFLNFPGLRYLELQANSLHGTIPSVIHKNTDLQDLNLADNSMSGTIPRGIGNLSNLLNFHLVGNVKQSCNWNNGYTQYSCTTTKGFNGTLPAEFYTLQSLSNTQMERNHLTGTISSKISQMTNLQTIRLSGNSLSGTFPSTISSLTHLNEVWLDNNKFTGTIPTFFTSTEIQQNPNWWENYHLLLHKNYFTGVVPVMPYSNSKFQYYTFDQNCLQPSSLVYMGAQTHCKPGSVGQRAPSVIPSASPTIAPVIPLPASGVSYVRISFSLNLYFNQLYNYNTYQYTYPNKTAALDPNAQTALANAFAEVLFLPRSAVSIDSYNYVGYNGCGQIGWYCSPSTAAVVTVLYQGTGLTPSVNAATDAFYEIIYAVTSQESSPLVNALNKFGFPNANFLNQISGYKSASDSYIAPIPGQPTPAPYPTPRPTTYRPPTPNYGQTTLNATSTGDNITTISHLNYRGGENFYWYITPPVTVPKRTKLIYTIHFPVFGMTYWDDLYIADTPFYSSWNWNSQCSSSSCPDIQITSTTGLTMRFYSYWGDEQYFDMSTMKGFVAQVTWQIYRPPNLAAEGLALCDLNRGRSSAFWGWDTSGGCYYNTSKPLYRPSWCSWSSIQCDADYRVNYLNLWGSSGWDNQYLSQHNMKRTIPTSLGNLKGLTSLTLGYMAFTGPLPTALYSLTKLNGLQLQGNPLTGSIPAGLTKLQQLNYMYLDNNRFNGTLPAALFALPRCSSISIRSNSLSGLPSEIPTNTVLQQLFLDNNRIGSTIPSALSNLIGLQQLGLSNNAQRSCNWNYNYATGEWSQQCTSTGGLHGTLPASFYTLPSLHWVDLSGNTLSGTISPSVSNLMQLQMFKLSGNNLNGTIPKTFSNLWNFYELDLDYNSLTGKIPTVFSRFFNASVSSLIKNGNSYRLLLHNNFLTGAIPPMPYAYGGFTFTLDNNCQLTSTYPAAILSSQLHCKPGTPGQRPPTMLPSPSPTTSPTVLPGLPYVQETFSLRFDYRQLSFYSCNYVDMYVGYRCGYQYVYPDVASMANPSAATALANAFADVLSLPHSAVTINSYQSFGNLGSDIGGNRDPMTKVTLTILYQGSAHTTADLYQSNALATTDRRNTHRTVSNTVNNVVGRSLQGPPPSSGPTKFAPTLSPATTSSPTTISPTAAPSSSAPSLATELTQWGIYNAFNGACNDFMNYRNQHPSYNQVVDNMSPLGIALRRYGFPNVANINNGNVQQLSASSYISPTPKPTSAPSTSTPTIKDAPTKPPVKLTGAPSDVIPPLDGKNFVLPGLDTVFATFGGDIHIRGKQSQPTLNSLVNIVLQAVGVNALPQDPQRLPLELGSVMHDGSFKYDVTKLLRTGEANFTGNAIVDGYQLLEPIEGLFQVLYFLGEMAVQFDQAAPAYLQSVHYNATESPSTAPTLPIPSTSPSFSPTLVPSAKPSLFPTTAPSFTPTLAPSSSPSLFPTTAPTVTPSFEPTFAPTVKPTFVPTFAPTLSKAAQLTIKLQNYLSSNLTQNSSASSHSSLNVMYQEVVARGAMPAIGGCSSWKVSTGSALSTTLLTQVATSVSMYVYNDNSNVGKIVQCTEGTSATNIIKAISSAGIAMTNVTCAGHSWRVQRCKGTRTSLCVDCANPCVATPATCSSLQTFNPCGGTSGTDGGGAGYGCTKTQTDVNMFRVLSGTFQLNPAFIPPVVSTLTIVPDKTTAVVTAVLSDDGTVYCGAFSTNTVPTSISQITAQSFVAASSSNTALVSMTGLSPATSYSVYCLTQSSLGTYASLATAIKTKIAVTTLCCKTITVAINVDSMFQTSSASNAVQVTMDASPSPLHRLVLAMSATDASGTVSSLIYGNSTYVSTSALIPLDASIGPASTVNTGTVTVTVTPSGTAASEYTVVYPQGQTFNVLSKTSPLPPPTLSSVRFSADGTALIASLSADSDLAGITQVHFLCTQLFTFSATAGLDATKCSWTDPSIVHITLDSNSVINVGDSVTLQGGQIRAACPDDVSATTCAGWSAMALTTTNVLAPVSPVIPSVAISAPSIIGMCDAFPIDLTSSVGSSGRVWNSISFTIKSTNTSRLTKAVDFLNNQYVFSPPSSVPAGYFGSGISQITVKMCNFLGACGTDSIQLAVTSYQAPVVTIGGDQSFSTTVAAPLSINGDGYVSICNYTAKGGATPAVTHEGLSFQWAAYVAGTQDFSLVSYSKQYYSYKLAPYSLTAGKTYTFTLTVIDDATSLSSTRSVQVMVVPSAVVAVISQGTVASVYQSGDITLSAGMSYDMDKFGVTGAAAGLTFKWSCAQTLPIISTSCSFSLPSGSNAQNLVILAASSLTVGTTSVVTVYVSSAGRTSTASITVTVISNDRPLVGVSAFDIVGKVVPEHPMALSGVALTTAGGLDSWTVSDSSIVLSSLSLTPSQNVAVSGGLSTVLLVLPAYSLTPGSSLTFTLSCSSKTTGFSSSASLSVVVNSPPQGGVFDVKPLTGRELTDKFTFSASRWWDTDLPINYAFGFVSPSTGLLTVIQSLSQRVYTKTSLPAGQDTSGYTLAGQMLVYDSYLSSTAATLSVQVNPSVVSNAALEQAVSSQLSNPATATQILGVAVALINNVKCSSAPDCAALNRLPCKAITNTCGSCASSDMIGVFLDSNAPCLTLAQAIAYGSSHRRRLDTAPTKTCLNNCGGSGVGTCGFVSVNTFAPVSSCVVTDPSCTAVCICASGHYGPSCALSQTDLQSQQSLRALLLGGFYNSTLSTDATADTVTAWVAQVVSLTRSYETLTPISMNIAVTLLQAIVTNAAHLQLPSAVVVGVIGACDAVAQAVLLNNPTSTSSRTLGPVVQHLMDLMEKYSSLALGQMNAMQYDSTLTSYQTFKSISAVKSVVTTSGSKSITVTVPPTATEKLASTDQASVVITNIVSGVANVKIGLVETKAHLFNATQTPHSRRLSTSNSWQSSTSVTSNLVKVVLPDVTVCGSASTSACATAVTLPTTTTETYSNGAAAAAAATWTVTCGIGSTTTTTNPTACPDGTYLKTVCNGGAVAYKYTQTCPWLVVAPTCGRVVASSSSTLNVVTDVCTTVSFTATSATCSCSLSTTTMLTDNSGSSNAGSIQLATVTTTSRLTTAAVTVYLSAAPSYRPTATPSYLPTATPSYLPTYNPSNDPTYNPTPIPSTTPTTPGMVSPTREPTTLKPTKFPTFSPTCKPTQEPTTAMPTYSPSMEPTHPTYTPTTQPTHPTFKPTAVPSTESPTITPSTEPSLNPSFAPVAANAPIVTVQATQTVAGVTSDSADFRTAFASAVMSLLPTGSMVTIVSVTIIDVRHRQLLTKAVSVVYTVQSTAPASTVTTSLASGTAAMTAVLQQSYPAATVAAPTVVTIANPTAAPTGAPIAASSNSGYNVSVPGAVAGGVLGFFALFFIVGGLAYRRQQKKKKVLVDKPQQDIPQQDEEQEYQDPFKGTVRIEGATGANATGINGTYKATADLSGDMPIYAKVGDKDVWLEYRPTRKQWQVKPTASKGVDGCWAYCAVPDKCLPQDCPEGQWRAVPAFVPQPDITVSYVRTNNAPYRESRIKPTGEESTGMFGKVMARVSTQLSLGMSQRSDR